MANKEQIEGEYDKAKGRVKQAAGDLADDENLKAEGTWDRVKGEAKKGFGDAKQTVRNVANELKEEA
jgi:uncharacterized protein YjbJ (UPF0337 family)